MYIYIYIWVYMCIHVYIYMYMYMYMICMFISISCILYLISYILYLYLISISYILYLISYISYLLSLISISISMSISISIYPSIHLSIYLYIYIHTLYTYSYVVAYIYRPLTTSQPLPLRTCSQNCKLSSNTPRLTSLGVAVTSNEHQRTILVSTFLEWIQIASSNRLHNHHDMVVEWNLTTILQFLLGTFATRVIMRSSFCFVAALLLPLPISQRPWVKMKTPPSQVLLIGST